jgi:hypothetical protein
MSAIDMIDLGWAFSRVYDAFRKMTPGRGFLAAVGAIVCAGLAAPRWLDRYGYNGVSDFSGPDWRAHEVAHNAWTAVRGGRGVHHPGYWVMGAQVQRVWKDPGHCEGRRTGDPVYEYRAEVQTYTIFAFPLQRVDVMCGATRYAPSGLAAR